MACRQSICAINFERFSESNSNGYTDTVSVTFAKPESFAKSKANAGKEKTVEGGFISEQGQAYTEEALLA